MNTLLNFSGGIDSTWCLYQYLKMHPDKKILVHHCTLKNWEGRSEVEQVAVENILDWMDDHGFTNYEYLNTTFDYGDVTHVVKDKEVIGFITGVILRTPKYEDVNRVIISSNLEDVSKTDYYERTEKNRKAILEATAQRSVEYVLPMAHLPRHELMATLPEDLLSLTWYCRKPNKENQPCNTCKTCKEVDRAKNKLMRTKETA